MSDNQQAQPGVLTPEQNLQNVEQVRDLFARAHDYIAQATYPGHMGNKIAEVLNFLAFQHADFKQRGETLANQIRSRMDVKVAEAKVAEVLEGKSSVTGTADGSVTPTTPRA